MDNKLFYSDYENKTKLFLSDTFAFLNEVEPETYDMIFADPPYFLSNDGITNKGGKMVSVNKGRWDKTKNIYEKHEFNKKWLNKCKSVLKPNGTIWVSGTLHNIYSVGMALEEAGFKILNNIIWEKKNPPPNLSCRYFTHSTETILWAKKNDKKSKHYFNYELMKERNNNKQRKDVWSGSLTPPREKKFGKHPTQKPEYLLEEIILASTKENDLILDPFVGSGTTLVVAKKLKRRGIGIDNNSEYLEIAKNRLENIDES